MARGTILFATHNEGKVAEVRGLLVPMRIEVISAGDLGLGVPEETEASFRGNARLKALAASLASGLPALADDSGLCVEALGGAPGVHTADWAETPTGRDFLHAMARTRAALVQAGAAEPWRAEFVCCMAYVEPEKECEYFEGRVTGRLVWPIRGQMGHGYDPMFVPDGDVRTFAEMGAEEKNRISHRALALGAFLKRRFT